MSIEWLPKQGPISEKDYRDLFTAIWPYQALYNNSLYGGYLTATGLTVRWGNTLYNASIEGYAINVSAVTDLSVTLEPWTTAYVYLVLDVAGGGLTVTNARFIAYPSRQYVPHSVLLAKCVTNATTATIEEYLVARKHPNLIAYAREWVCLAPDSEHLWMEQSTKSTTEVLVKQFKVELPGTYQFSIDMTRTAGTETVTVYCASTGDTPGTSTPQLTFTETYFSPPVWGTKTGVISCSEGDTVSVYCKISNASYTAYVSTCSFDWYYGIPMAPGFAKE